MMGQTRKTPLHVAASKDLKDIVSLLISKGADIDCIDKVCLYVYKLLFNLLSILI